MLALYILLAYVLICSHSCLMYDRSLTVSVDSWILMDILYMLSLSLTVSTVDS